MRSDQDPREAFPTTFAPSSQWDVAVLRAASKKPRMVIAPRESPFMFDVTLDGLRGPGPDANHRNDALVPTSELGARRLVRKPGPGPSSGLLGDPSGGLLFFQAGPDGGAVMRWDPRLGAGPRGYVVVHRDNGTLPLTSAVFLDGQGAAWAACTTFAPHLGDGGIHHADEDADDYEEEDDESEDESDEENGVINNEDHDDLEIDHFDDGDHYIDNAPPPPPPPPSPTFRRSNSCRYPRAVGWKIREVAQRQDDGSRQDSEEHAAEPQEYVCMSPADAPSKAIRVAPCASAAQTGPSRRVASRTRRPVKEQDDVNTMMITRRAGQFDGSGLRTSAGHHKTVLVHDGHPARGPSARRPRDPTHCVRLHWDE
ncbi:hypothetical protein FOCC_FOCC005761 [Frankliniella occidentalis]|nr:hypothetical protein FOCC_FOCC005761 [Frankliniella occidentalis]